jgi:hypothetical protein
MTDRVPTRAQALRAAARLPMTLIKDKAGLKRWPVYSFSMCKPHCRVVDITARNNTSGNTEPAYAGALLTAAGGSVRDMNAALRRASQIMGDWLDMPDAPAFTHVVVERALLLLRSGWKRKDSDAERRAAETLAEVAAALPTVLYIDEDAEDEQARYAAEHNARVEAELRGSE